MENMNYDSGLLLDIIKRTISCEFGITEENAENISQSVMLQYENEVDNLKSEEKETLRKYDEMRNDIETLSCSELKKFIEYAKEQGTNMLFRDMENGVLEAGRKDMQTGLSEILNSLSFDKPTCSECGEGLTNKGKQKKT